MAIHQFDGLEQALLYSKIAYTVLPNCVQQVTDDLVKHLVSTPAETLQWIYCKAAAIMDIREEDLPVVSFRLDRGELNHDYSYYVIEYPRLSPIDIQQLSRTDRERFFDAQSSIPYLSAIVVSKRSHGAACFAMASSPRGEPVLVSVTPQEMNVVEYGCIATLEGMLNRLRLGLPEQRPSHDNSFWHDSKRIG